MALTWNIPNMVVDLVKDKLNSTINNAAVPGFAKIVWQGNDLLVQIDRGGKSELRFALQSDGNGVRFAETKRDIALLHRPFVGAVETFVDKLLTDVGFRRT